MASSQALADRRRDAGVLVDGWHMPVFLLAAFAKNAKVSLSESERRALVKVAKDIVAQYGRQKR